MNKPGSRSQWLRRAVALTAVVALATTVGACTEDGHQLSVEFRDEAPASTVLTGDDVSQTAVALSSALFDSSDVAMVATDDTVDALAAVSSQLGLPLLIGTDQAVVEETERLGVGTVVTAEGADVTELGDDLDVVEIDPTSEAAKEDVPAVSVHEAPTTTSLLVDPEQDVPAQNVARSAIEAAGGTVTEIPGGDPRHSSETVAAAKEATGDDPSTGVVALGQTFGTDEDLTSRLQTAISVPELPGGGQVVFPDRRMIAAYGSPEIPALGVLGEQPLQDTIDRVQQIAADYEGLTDEPVVPAFEIITTVASSEPGADGDYSSEVDPEKIREWVDAAKEAGIYVVLDLQPGTTDFLTQAKEYEDLLKEPHVGLALDPEWRLKPGQKHLAQIGSVEAEEVNETAQWLADLTAENNLPQKLLILHQFSNAMITDRQDIDTSHPELAITVHADGHGTPDLKMGTWDALQHDLPEGIFMSWKNFYDEDTPTFTPEQTYEVDPRPWFVSYQ